MNPSSYITSICLHHQNGALSFVVRCTISSYFGFRISGSVGIGVTRTSSYGTLDCKSYLVSVQIYVLASKRKKMAIIHTQKEAGKTQIDDKL